MMFDLVIRARRAITPTGERPAAIGIRAGRIAAVESVEAELPAEVTVELAADEVLLPGLVDSHVHVNEPGRTEWEGFQSATRAAAAGGITTIVDMPLNSVPPTTDVDALETKRAIARTRAHVDVGFWGGAVGSNLAELPALHEAGVFGFKAFLLDSGVEEFGHLDDRTLADTVAAIAKHHALLIVHAEDAHTIATAPPAHGRRYADFLASRPSAAENIAIASIIALAERYGARAHILHLSSAEALPMIADARRRGVALTVETCPHYLTFCAEEIPDGATEFKCCPPIRSAANRELLWAGLGAGIIDCVVSDHSPCTPELKRFDVGDFGVAWGGIAGLQLGLSTIWTQARQRGFALSDVVDWMAKGPADLVGITRKGRIDIGADADFCVFAPDDAFVVNVHRLAHRNPVSAYHDRPLAGIVRQTWLRGERITGDRPAGMLLERGKS
ncbi:MAG TPA: allantoinase AllB [Pseudonocardiaceae bacterium]|jgi:allantoinase|nr:allantoinase AllB [Pseudonocardiaceae bacterium]